MIKLQLRWEKKSKQDHYEKIIKRENCTLYIWQGHTQVSVHEYVFARLYDTYTKKIQNVGYKSGSGFVKKSKNKIQSP